MRKYFLEIYSHNYMGNNSRFSQVDIRRMKRLREHGASLSEIADIFGSNGKTVFYYVRDVQPSRDGHKIELVKEFINEWLPQLPWEDEGLPLPRWLVRDIRDRLNQK
jgi:hypothetical protein